MAFIDPVKNKPWLKECVEKETYYINYSTHFNARAGKKEVRVPFVYFQVLLTEQRENNLFNGI